jgi:hypothetical protein
MRGMMIPTILLAAADRPHWLGRLGLIDGPPGTTLHSASLGLRGGMPVWLAVILLVLCAAGAVYLYLRESAKLSLAWRLILAGLRSALIGLVLLLLLRPVILGEFVGQRARPVVLLIDDSQSMSRIDRRTTDADKVRVAVSKGLVPPSANVSDASVLQPLPPEQLKDPTRAELVKAVLGNEQLKMLDQLRDKGPLQVYLFDAQLRPAEGDVAAAVKAEGARSAIADAVQEALTRASDEPPAAIVLVTDGRDNGSQRTLDEAARACRERGVALHVWGVGSSDAGALQLIDVNVPRTVFLDEKPDAKDDPIEVPIRFRCRGFKQGTIVLTLKVGDQTVTQTMPVTEGENLIRTLRLEPKKGKEGERPVSVSIKLKDSPDVGDEARKVVQVKNSRVKILYVENLARREYKFIQPVLDRDRRALLRVWLVEGDRRLAEMAPDRESGSLFVDRFPESFPDPSDKDPDRRPYDLVIIGDVPFKALGEKAAKSLRQFVREGGGLVVLAGRQHCPAEYAGSTLAEVLPVEFTKQEFTPDDAARATPFKLVLTYDGEQSNLTSLDDVPEENKRLWKEDLWQNVPGFYWHYPVTDLRPGATSLVVHPEKKTLRKPDVKPMPIVATQFYGKGQVLFVGTDETWRWRDGTADRLTARFWGQIAMQLGLPHLLGNSKRTQLDLERGIAVLGRPGGVKARLLDSKYDPVIRPEVKGVLVNLDAKEDGVQSREIVLRRVSGQPGEYRASMPNDAPGRHEIRIAGGDGLEPATLPYRVELPPRHELEEVGMAADELRGMAAAGSGSFYREEDLYRLGDAVKTEKASFTIRQEVILWNNLALFAFVVLITAEWVARKLSNLS